MPSAALRVLCFALVAGKVLITLLCFGYFWAGLAQHQHCLSKIASTSRSWEWARLIHYKKSPVMDYLRLNISQYFTYKKHRHVGGGGMQSSLTLTEAQQCFKEPAFKMQAS